MLSRMWKTHVLRGISIFAGPPGIGKTTAIEAFHAMVPGESLHLVAPPTKPKAREFLSILATAMKCHNPDAHSRGYQEGHYLRKALRDRLCDIAQVNRYDAPDWSIVPAPEKEAYPRLTVLIDEAQFLSRDAIELTRFMNDPVRTHAPFPVSFVFVGNDEEALSPGTRGESLISAAVADRSLFIERLGYKNLLDADLAAYVRSIGVDCQDAANLIIRLLQRKLASRSLRTVRKEVDSIREFAGDRPVTVQVVKDYYEG